MHATFSARHLIGLIALFMTVMHLAGAGYGVPWLALAVLLLCVAVLL